MCGCADMRICRCADMQICKCANMQMKKQFEKFLALKAA
jgi:hypothetical protein